MKILFVPIISKNKIDYIFYDEKIEIVLEHKKQKIKNTIIFSELPNGEMITKNNESIIKTTIPNILLEAKKENNELFAKLIMPIAIDEERSNILFPEIIDSKDYQCLLKEDVDINNMKSDIIINISEFWKSEHELKEQELKEQEKQRIIDLIPDNEDRINYLEQAILFLMME